jgi:hypothetical protein
MDPITVSTMIDRPREVVFAYLSDLSNHPEFTDHYQVDWHLTREDPVGVGAGARYRVKAPFVRFGWADTTIAECAPHRIVERGRAGKYNRIRRLAVYTLSPASSGTKVEYTIESEVKLPSDKLLDALGRGHSRRQAAKAMRRLRSILEEDRGRGRRATVAAR